MGAWQQNTHGIFQHNCKQTAIVMEKSSKPHELIHLIVPFTSAMMEENHSKVVDTWDKYLCTQSTPSYLDALGRNKWTMCWRHMTSAHQGRHWFSQYVNCQLQPPSHWWFAGAAWNTGFLYSKVPVDCELIQGSYMTTCKQQQSKPKWYHVYKSSWRKRAYLYTYKYRKWSPSLMSFKMLSWCARNGWFERLRCWCNGAFTPITHCTVDLP